MEKAVSHHPFATLGLSDASLRAIVRAGYLTPTPVQAKAIPPALSGRDVIGCAETGTGKTAAFVLPLLERIEGAAHRDPAGPVALVLAPTRELALQIAGEVDKFGRDRRVRLATVIGGVGMEPQIRALRGGCQVVIATPGRLLDHMERGTVRFGALQILVLDEADRMLDMGFRPQLDRILRGLPPRRQTMLFSATMAGEVAGFAGRHLTDPVRIDLAPTGTVAPRAEQRVYHVPQQEKASLLLALLEGNDETTLVFTRTKRRAEKLAAVLQRAGHPVARIHADRSQGQRRQALDGFRQGTYRVLVATDIAARGIDVLDIGHVVNFDLSHTPTDHVHRVGRTARASREGLASSFVSPEERALLRDIEKFTRASIPRGDLPSGIAAIAPVASDATPVRRPAPRTASPRQAAPAAIHRTRPSAGLRGRRGGRVVSSWSGRPSVAR